MSIDRSTPSTGPSAGSFLVGNRPVGRGAACLVVGEVGLAHDGSLGLAHAFIDAIADCRADAVKFQTHIAEAESTPAEPFRIPFSPQDGSRYEYWQRTAFDLEGWVGLARHAGERGLIFLSSPFSTAAVDLLQRVGVPAWKVGSGEVGNLPLLEHIASTQLPVLLSSGMSLVSELDAAVDALRPRSPIAVLQCTSAYPVQPEQLGLNLLRVFAERYGCPVGLSDHSGTIYPSIAAVTLGANVIEVHVTLSRAMFGPDVASSVTTDELRQLVDGVRMIEVALANPVDKDALADGLEPLRALFTKSLVAARDLAAGTVLEATDLVLKKPGTGIASGRLADVVGRRVARDVPADTLLSEGDLE